MVALPTISDPTMDRHLPEFFVNRMKADGLADVADALGDTPPTVSIRINRRKGAEEPAAGRPVAWNADGFYLPSRPAFTFDPAFHQGLYYVQDASSMAIAPAVAQAVADSQATGPLRYLDACAAPGGKTTAAMAQLPDDTFVVANEFDPRRASVLRENIAKWGRPAVVTRSDASRLRRLDGFFDIIAADMPCSGEGMMRKEEVAVSQWSQALVDECACRQRAIAESLWRCLAPGGTLIYSTCTFNREENEEIVQWLIDDFGAIPVAIDALDKAPGVSGALAPYAFPAYRFMPGRSEGEGLFLAMVRRPADNGRRMNPRTAPRRPEKTSFDFLAGDWCYLKDGNGVNAVPSAHLPLVAAVGEGMNIMSSGITVGEIKGKDLVPDQALAMSADLRPDAFPRVELDRQSAIAYLRRENVAAPDAPKGLVLMCCDGHPLGFAKNLGNRANNLYPAEWRIRSSQRPDGTVS